MRKVDINTNANILDAKWADFSAVQNDTDFTFHDNITLHNIEFKNCRFQLARSGITLEINDCRLENIAVVGLQSEAGKASSVKLINIQEGRQIRLTKTFGVIEVAHSTLDRFTDESLAETVTFTFATITNFKILGSSNHCSIRHSKFGPLSTTAPRKEVSIWNKKIFATLSSEHGIFGDIRLNPFYFATRCHNRKSIDLSQVTLIDDWSMLRKNYAGVRLWIVFLLTMAYFLPLIVHSYFLLILGRTGMEVTQETTLWRVLLFGNDTGINAFIHFLLTSILLFYNIGRLWLTLDVSKLMEEQQFLNDSSFDVVAVHPDKLIWHLRLHNVLNFLFWVSVAYTLYKIWTAMMVNVPTAILPS